MRSIERALAAALLLAAAVPCAAAAPQTGATLAGVAAALNAGDSDTVPLATAALSAPGLTRADRAQLLLDRGLAHEQRGDRDVALADFTAAIGMHALTPLAQARGLFARGVTLDGLNRTGDAMADYTAAIRVSPKFAPALNNRANIWRRRGDMAAARRDYLAALAAINLHPEFSYFGLGQIAETRGDKTAALGFYTQAVAANPAYGEAAGRLAALDRPGADPITLRPPQPIRLHRPAAAPPKPRARVSGPVLRPAMDDAPVTRFSGAEVQLGAWRSRAQAQDGWRQALARAGSLLRGLAPRIIPSICRAGDAITAYGFARQPLPVLFAGGWRNKALPVW